MSVSKTSLIVSAAKKRCGPISLRVDDGTLDVECSTLETFTNMDTRDGKVSLNYPKDVVKIATNWMSEFKSFDCRKHFVPKVFHVLKFAEEFGVSMLEAEINKYFSTVLSSRNVQDGDIRSVLFAYADYGSGYALYQDAIDAVMHKKKVMREFTRPCCTEKYKSTTCCQEQTCRFVAAKCCKHRTKEQYVAHKAQGTKLSLEYVNLVRDLPITVIRDIFIYDSF